MVKAAYFLACETALQDRESGKNSYINVFERIMLLRGVEETYRDISIAGRLVGVEPNESLEIKLKLSHDVTGDILCEADLNGSTKTSAVNLIFRFSGVRISKEGRYSLKVSCNKDQVDTSGFYLLVEKES